MYRSGECEDGKIFFCFLLFLFLLDLATCSIVLVLDWLMIVCILIWLNNLPLVWGIVVGGWGRVLVLDSNASPIKFLGGGNPIQVFAKVTFSTIAIASLEG